jgi:hypothetical protein
VIGSFEAAAEILKAVLSWELSQRKWQEVDEVLLRMAEAVKAGDGAAVSAQNRVLALCAPQRVSRHINPAMGTAEQSGAPPALRELVYELVHQLAPECADAQRPGGGGEVDGDRRPSVPE